MKLLFSLFLVIVALQISSPLSVIHRNGRIRGFSDRTDKDFVLGFILPIHASKGATCTDRVFVEASEFVDAFLYSLDLVNSNRNILPNITLGYDVRDSCLTESIALEESVDLVLLSNSENYLSCNNTENIIPVSAIISEYVSSVTIPVANFLRPFNVPQISFSATSAILNNRERYEYFFRTIPSDDQQAQAMIDLALRFGWTYVSTLHSNDLYGEPGIERFMELAKRNGICIDLDIGTNEDFTDEQYESVVKMLYNSTANVVILFSSLRQVKGLFQQIQSFVSTLERSKQRTFMWVASDAWIESPEIHINFNEIVGGMWGFIPISHPDTNFYQYFSQQTPSNTMQPWYREFHEFYYNCTQNGKNCTNDPITSHSNYRNNSITPLLIDAVFAFAHALDSFLNDNCKKPIVWNTISRKCEGQTKILDGGVIRDYLRNVSFTSPTQNHVMFDDTGSVKGTYRVLNYQKFSAISGNKMYKLVDVGDWNGTRSSSSELQIHQDHVPFLQFGIDINGIPQMQINSRCRQCPNGNVIKVIQSSCCGTCSPCVGQNYTPFTNLTDCHICLEYTWGNNPLSGSDACRDIPETYLDPTDTWGIILIVTALLGTIAVVTVAIIMGIFWETAIMKSTGREQMTLLLIGIELCYIATIFFVIKPSIPICFFQRICTWLCLSLIVCALFVKLVRIARIFLYKSTKPLKFITPVHQVILTLILVGFQMILVTISLIVVHPVSEKQVKLNAENTNNFPLLIVQCKPPHTAIIAIQMLYLSAMLIVSNALAMLTIRFPANFKEVRYVASSSFSIGIIWIAFVITYFATDNEFQSATVSFAIQMSAFAVLICMYGPRVFIMTFLPGKNMIQETISKFTSSATLKSQKQSVSHEMSEQ